MSRTIKTPAKKAVKVLSSNNEKKEPMTIGEAFLIQVGLNKMNGNGLDGEVMMDYIDFKVTLDEAVEHGKKAMRIMMQKYNVKHDEIANHPKAAEIIQQMNRVNAEPVKVKVAPLNFISRKMLGEMMSGVNVHIQQKTLIAKYLMATKT
jgi:hypothetical protein